MQLAKLITPKIIKTLHCQSARRHGFFLTFLILFISALSPVLSQDNSPYSRYGIGDLVPSTPISNRGMGGISAGYTDYLSINFSNPASYSSFQAVLEQKSKKLISGRAILDFGLNFENRTLSEPKPSTAEKFTASNALFSYIQVGVPLKNNWGLSFGLRPISRISYNIISNVRLKDPQTGLPIDSASTSYTGNGGAYLASVGTGFTVFEKSRANGNVEKLSVGFNAGYYFGIKDYSSRRSFINDTVNYYQANYETKINYGSMFFNAGVQYRVPLKNKIILTVGAYGNWGQKISATQDKLRETFLFDANAGYLRLDSISDSRNVKGKINIPSSYTIGFVAQKYVVPTKEGGWLVGIDFSQQNWSQYRVYGQKDSLRNNWNVKIGGQFNPIPKRNYFSNVTYRVGLFFGPDYVQVKEKLMQVGASFGLGLPVAISRQAPNQITLVNLAFEYGKRGNNDNLLKENTFRFSLGFSLSDFWFIKRKYD